MRKAPSFVVESDDTMMDELDHDMGVQGQPGRVPLPFNRLTSY